MPTYAFVRIGGIPRTIRAIATFMKPKPTKATTIAIRASSGIARAELPTPIAKISPFP